MAGPAMMGGNRSKWRPNSAAAMNNNPMGVQSVMQPTAPPMAPTMPPRPFAPRPVAPNPLPSANPGYGPPATTGGGGPPAANAPTPNVPAVQTQPQGQPPALNQRPNIRIPGPPSVPGVTVTPLPSRGMVDQFAQNPYGQAAGMTPRPQPPAPLSPPQVPKMNTAPVQDAAPPEQTFAGSAAGRQSGMGMMSPPQSAQAARASDLRQQTADSKWRMAQSAATPLAPTPPNRFFQPQGRDPQNPSQFDVRNVGPGGGYFVDRGGQTQPRQDTSMARNVMAGQPAEGSASFGRPMNIPGATQSFNGQTYTQPQVYNPGGGYGPTGNGLIPGSAPRLNPQDEAARASQYNQMYKDSRGSGAAMSPDEYRVLTDGRAMVSPAEARMSGPVSGGNPMSSTSATIQNRNARARGVRGSDVAQWSARRNAEMQASLNPTGGAATETAATGTAAAAASQQQQPANPYTENGYGSNPIGGFFSRMFGLSPSQPNATQPAAPVGPQPAVPVDPQSAAQLNPPSVPKLNVMSVDGAVSNRPDGSQYSAGRPWRRRPAG